MRRESMSRPSSSDPQTCASEGGESRVARLMFAGSCGASHGAKMAHTMKNTTNTTPMAASGLRWATRGSEMAVVDTGAVRRLSFQHAAGQPLGAQTLRPSTSGTHPYSARVPENSLPDRWPKPIHPAQALHDDTASVPGQRVNCCDRTC